MGWDPKLHHFRACEKGSYPVYNLLVGKCDNSEKGKLFCKKVIMTTLHIILAHTGMNLHVLAHTGTYQYVLVQGVPEFGTRCAKVCDYKGQTHRQTKTS